MTRTTGVVLAAGLGLVGVAAGAFGAHGLRDSVTPEALDIWKTGAHYQQLHAAVMLAVCLHAGPWSRLRRAAALCFAVGIAIFAGTLYGLTLGGPRLLGAITPLGGLSLMAGWLMTGVYAVRDRPFAAADPTPPQASKR